MDIYKSVLEDRISELWRYRQWCRQQPDAAFWSPLRLQYEVELRALIHVARLARDLDKGPTFSFTDKVTVPMWH